MIRARIRQVACVTGFVVLTAVISSCDATPTSPSDQPFSATDIRAGTGALALNGDLLQVHYIGWLYDPARADGKGGVFDTSRNGTPFVFTLGASEVIPGWDQGVVGMSVGAVRRLVIPPNLAYGSSRAGPLPQYSTLIFEIELLAIGQESVEE
jgi:FKBP-type peptidyl-prolyl cis-trans isomerase